MNEAELIETLKRKFGKVRRDGRGYLNIPCPTCKPSNAKKAKRWVSPHKIMSGCWICELPIPNAMLLGCDFVPLPCDKVVEEEQKENPLAQKLPGNKFIPINQLPETHPAIAFLRKDHLTELDRYYNEHGIVYCPSDGGITLPSRTFVSSADRIIFPIMFRGKFVGWQARSIPGTTYGDLPDCMRYYHIFNKGKYLFNYDQAKKYKMVILVEGIKKALKLPNTVATLGKSISPTQKQLIQEWDMIVIMLDSEEEAQQQAELMVQGINMGTKQAININLGKYGFPSPDEATTEELELIVFKEWQKHEERYKGKVDSSITV